MTANSANRYHINVTPKLAEELAQLQSELGLETRKDVFCTSVEVLLWMIRRRREGRVLMAVNPNTGAASELSFVGLDRVQPNSQPATTVGAVALAHHGT